LATGARPRGLTAQARLLRVVDEPLRFVSVGPWETLDAIRRWRALPGFQEHATRFGEGLESFGAHTLEQVAEQ
jgi:heme-degrading monooxygenase HmoA